MNNQNPLVKYLQENKDNFPPEVLRKRLIEAGYTLEQVAEASQIVYGSEAVPPPPPPPPSAPAPSEYKPEESISPLTPPSPESYQPAPPQFQPQAPQKESGFEWETILGGNWLVRIGIAALVFGTAFFFKWAFDHNIIGLVGRLILGLVGGTALIAVGDYFRSKYKVYSQLLVGGGIAILYLTVFAAFYIYHKVSPELGFGGMIMITAVAGLLAIRQNAPSIAAVGMVGGFGTPLMFLYDIAIAARGVTAETVDAVTRSGIPWYLLVLNLGVLAICALKNWRQLILIGLVGTYVMYGIWLDAFSKVTDLWLQEFYLLLYFLIFAAATILYNLLWKKKTIPTDIWLIVLNAAIFFVWSYSLLSWDYKEWLGLLPAFLAAFYISLGYLALSRYKEDALLSISLGGIGTTSLVLVPALQWGYPWMTISWATLTVIFTWIGFQLQLKEMRYAGIITLLLAAIRLLFIDIGKPRSPLFGDQSLLFFNEQFLVFFSVIAATFLAAYFYSKWQEQTVSEEKGVLPALLLGGNFLALFALTHEVGMYFADKARFLWTELSKLYGKQGVFGPPQEEISRLQEQIRNIKNVRNFSVSFLWMLYALAALIVGIARRSRLLRIFGLVLLWIVIFKVFLYDLFIIRGGWRVAGFISLGVILLATGYLYNRYGQRIKEFLFEASKSESPGIGYNLPPQP